MSGKSCHSVACDLARVGGCDKQFCFKLLSDEEQLLARAIITLWKAGGWSRSDIVELFGKRELPTSYGFINTVIEELC